MARTLTRSLAAAGAALALSATVASAQSFTYYTTGFFYNNVGLGDNCGGPPPGNDQPAGTAVASCITPSGTLTFRGTTLVTRDAPTFIELGTFDLVTTASGNINGDEVFFTLVVNQTDPTMGTDSQVGTFTGSFTTTSSLIYWRPDDTMLNVFPVDYEIITSRIPRTDEFGVAVPLGESTIEGFVTQQNVVPEPATVLLLGSGLAGLGLFGLRNRRRSAGAA